MLTLTKGLLTAISKAAHDVSREARLPKGAKGGGEFTKIGGAPTEDDTQPAGMPDKYAKPPKGIVSYPLSRIVVDAARMQFRQDVNPDSGTDDRLSGITKFDQTLAGVLLVWKDPVSGKVLVADGHHRYALAKRLGVRNVNVEFLPAPTAHAAMIRAAVVNIASGHSTAKDAAMLFRADGMGEKALRNAGISLEGTVGAKGLALSKLAPTLWAQYVSGKLPEGRAIAIGRNFKTHAEQVALAGLLNVAKYKTASDAVVAEIAKQVPSAGRHTKTVQTLFGEESITKNLAVEKAQLVVSVRNKLLADKKLFGFVAKQGHADDLKRGGNSINVVESQRIASAAARLTVIYDAISGYAGSLSPLLSAGAKQIAEGAKVNVVTDGIFQSVRESLINEFGSGANGGFAGGRADDSGHQGLESEAESDGGLFRGVNIAPTFIPPNLLKAAGSRAIGGGLSALPLDGGKEVHGKWGQHNARNAFLATNGDVYQRPSGKSSPFTLVHGPSLAAKPTTSTSGGGKGQTWSERLESDNPGSHWATRGGKRVLIKKDGKEAPRPSDAPKIPTAIKVAVKTSPKQSAKVSATLPSKPSIPIPVLPDNASLADRLTAARQYARDKYDELKSKAAETKSPIWKAKYLKDARAQGRSINNSKVAPLVIAPISSDEMRPENLNIARLHELEAKRQQAVNMYVAAGGHDTDFNSFSNPQPIPSLYQTPWDMASQNATNYEDALEAHTLAQHGFSARQRIHVTQGKEKGRAGVLSGLNFAGDDGVSAHVTLEPRVKMEGDSGDDETDNKNFISQMFNTDLAHLVTSVPLDDLGHGDAPTTARRKIRLLSPKAKELIANSEKSSVNLPYERGFCVSPSGEVLMNRKGSKDTITLSKSDIAAITNVDAVMTHNHPGWQEYGKDDPMQGWLSFSRADVETSISCGLAEIRAVTGKYIYSMKPGQDEWGEARAIAVRPAIHRMVDEVKNEWMPKIAGKKMSCERANMEAQHEMWKRLAGQFGWDYTRTEHKMLDTEPVRARSKATSVKTIKKSVESGGVELDAEFRDPMFTPEKVEAWKRHNIFKGMKVAMLFKCGGKGKDCDGKKPSNLSQLVRDAHHTNKHVVAAACDHENADKVLIAGEGKTKYPATHCKRCGRIALDDKKHHKLASNKVPMPTLMKAVAAGLYDLGKAVAETEEPTAPDHSQNPAFKHWFGQSQTVNEDGKPKVFYHGSPSKPFKSFDKTRSGNQHTSSLFGGMNDEGFYAKGGTSFTPNKEEADSYRLGKKGSGYAVHLKMEHPINLAHPELPHGFRDSYNRVRAKNDLEPISDERYEKIEHKWKHASHPIGTEYARGQQFKDMQSVFHEHGVDGVIAGHGEHAEHIVFHPSQIKHVDNKGTFDSTTNNMYKAVDIEVTEEMMHMYKGLSDHYYVLGDET
jgi:hypothetical protein